MGATVLLVDDEPHVIDGLRRTLRKERFNILSANNADEALALLETQHVDVIISDDLMPGMRGSELLALIEERYPNVIRVMLTGSAGSIAKAGQLQDGPIQYFLAKPTSGQKIAELVREELKFRDSRTD